MSGGKCGVPVGSAKVSGEACDATLAGPRLLNRLPDDRRRGGERESSPAPKRQKFSCSNVCVLGVHSIKMHTFSQKELSPPHSINAAPLAPPQSSAGPPPTQVIAAHPTTKPLKPLCQFMSAWKVIPGISRWLLSVIERGYTLQFRRRPPRFNGVVQSLTSPRNAQALRQEIGCLLEKGAVERVPPNELESGFYSRYFLVPKRDGGLRPILDLRPINRALCKRPFRMITLKQILAQIRPGNWFASVDLTMVGTSDPMAHKPLGTGSSLFSSKGVSGTTGTATCTDSHRQHVCSFVHKSPGRHSFQGFVRAGSDFTAMRGLSASLHQSNAHLRSLESRGGHAFKEENSSRRMEVTPRVGSDDLDPLRESGGGFIRYERECTLPVVLLPVPLPAGRGRTHSALASSQALCVSSDQNIASGVMQDQGGASVSDTHSPELAEPALVSRPDRAVDSSSLADSGQEDRNRCGTRTRNYGAFMCGCFRVVRGAKCISLA